MQAIFETDQELHTAIPAFQKRIILGINLKTETPFQESIKAAIELVLVSKIYRNNVCSLAAEFAQYNPALLCEPYVNQLTGVLPEVSLN